MMTRSRAARFEASYTASTATINGARVEFDDWLSTTPGVALAESAVLVLSELISNAIQASPDTAYKVAATCGERALELSVTNDAPGANVPTPSTWDPNQGLAVQGRGLGIVRAIADHVQIDEHDGRITITARLLVPDLG